MTWRHLVGPRHVYCHVADFGGMVAYTPPTRPVPTNNNSFSLTGLHLARCGNRLR